VSESTDAERWLPVVGYESLYEVSSRGRVRSLDRVTTKSNGRICRYKGRILKPGQDGYGYLSVALCVDGVAKVVRIHTLVLQAFHGPPPFPRAQGRHGPAGYLDNSLGNLSWGTYSENSYDRQRDGTDYYRNRTHCPHEHELKEPNLKLGKLANSGHRECLACAQTRCRAYYAKRKGKPFDFQAEVTICYERIMTGLVTQRLRCRSEHL
jgi:hypothetical protein